MKQWQRLDFCWRSCSPLLSVISAALKEKLCSRTYSITGSLFFHRHQKIEFLLLFSVMSPSQISHSCPSVHAYGHKLAHVRSWCWPFRDKAIVFVYNCLWCLCLHVFSVSKNGKKKKNLVRIILDLAECRTRALCLFRQLKSSFSHNLRKIVAAKCSQPGLSQHPSMQNLSSAQVQRAQ